MTLYLMIPNKNSQGGIDFLELWLLSFWNYGGKKKHQQIADRGRYMDSYDVSMVVESEYIWFIGGIRVQIWSKILEINLVSDQ